MFSEYIARATYWVKRPNGVVYRAFIPFTIRNQGGGKVVVDLYNKTLTLDHNDDWEKAGGPSSTIQKAREMVLEQEVLNLKKMIADLKVDGFELWWFFHRQKTHYRIQNGKVIPITLPSRSEVEMLMIRAYPALQDILGKSISFRQDGITYECTIVVQQKVVEPEKLDNTMRKTDV